MLSPKQSCAYHALHHDIECHADLLCPADTVMDLNIGAALWLAAQAEGEMYGEGGLYRSRARVVLLGHGADELCGGYGRHRTAFLHQVTSLPTSVCHTVMWRSIIGRMYLATTKSGYLESSESSLHYIAFCAKALTAAVSSTGSTMFCKHHFYPFHLFRSVQNRRWKWISSLSSSIIAHEIAGSAEMYARLIGARHCIE